MFDRGESKDDLELSYHCSSATHSEPEEEEEDLDTLQMGVPLNTGSLVPVPSLQRKSHLCIPFLGIA